MVTDPSLVAFGWGAVLTMIFLVLSTLWLATENYPPVKKRAWRVTFFVVLLSGSLTVAGGMAIYDANRIIGAFLAFPCVLIVPSVAWLIGRATYRAMGGPPPQPCTDSALVVEKETLEGHGGIWCQLRELPHFRETTGGELINLATGDRVYWTTLNEHKCIRLRLGGTTKLSGSRFETLTKYLAVQQGMAKMLGLVPDEAANLRGERS